MICGNEPASPELPGKDAEQLRVSNPILTTYKGKLQGAAVVGNGYLLALTREHAKRIFAQPGGEQLRQLLEELRQTSDLKKSGRVLELGNLWDPLHRCLTEGELDPNSGDVPLNLAILGGRQLHQGNEWAAAMVRPDMTTFVAEALGDVKEEEFRQKFFALNPASYCRTIDEKHFMEVWVALRQVTAFYEASSENLEAVVFAGQFGP
jgi:hypothetical protein